MGAFLPLYKAGHLAVIHACGSPNPSRSHFDMQDFMESGVPADKSVHSGWLNRALQAKGEGRASPFRAVAMTSLVPRTLQGDVEALAIHDLATFGVNASGASGQRGFRLRRACTTAPLTAYCTAPARNPSAPSPC